MRKILVAVLAFAGFLVAGEAEAQKKTLVIGMGSADAGKLDPHIASTTPDKGVRQKRNEFVDVGVAHVLLM